MRIIFASNNASKLREISAVIGGAFSLVSLADISFQGEIPETGNTLEENALQKAGYIHARFGTPVFADDSGLEVDCLDGAPGVDTAHYSGSRDADANMDKLLKEMEVCGDRSATFKTVIAYVTSTEKRCFVGEVKGRISTEKRGEGGFGYDPVFIPEGETETFANLPPEVKAEISHRAKAVKAFVNFLKADANQ